MVYKIADNILSPLGETTAQNYEAVKAGRSVNLTTGTVPIVRNEGLTHFEAMAVKSARHAIQEAGIDPSGNNVVLILSSQHIGIIFIHAWVLVLLSLLFIAMVGTDHHFVVLAADGRVYGVLTGKLGIPLAHVIQSDALLSRKVCTG